MPSNMLSLFSLFLCLLSPFAFSEKNHTGYVAFQKKEIGGGCGVGVAALSYLVKMLTWTLGTRNQAELGDAAEVNSILDFGDFLEKTKNVPLSSRTRGSFLSWVSLREAEHKIEKTSGVDVFTLFLSVHLFSVASIGVIVSPAYLILRKNKKAWIQTKGIQLMYKWLEETEAQVEWKTKGSSSFLLLWDSFIYQIKQ